jgi:hypothetical protein
LNQCGEVWKREKAGKKIAARFLRRLVYYAKMGEKSQINKKLKKNGGAYQSSGNGERGEVEAARS